MSDLKFFWELIKEKKGDVIVLTALTETPSQLDKVQIMRGNFFFPLVFELNSYSSIVKNWEKKSRYQTENRVYFSFRIFWLIELNESQPFSSHKILGEDAETSPNFC